ncbi:N-terminal double-transmembrane domain-containing protein [Reichenbachiella agariperforans]|uniref:N-terminal double-transmembrane domain-containing protein n=1 Tax=Reichenbachiella agariperforans TaxID=156994 RepID=A0A1M6QLX7_REIAG|nr:BatA domain-containing protein [Reichenbachiella agariperforans]SHK21073.1 N-terminal double-transmembrane domain-containing protein [Reichenbachiella agariperforans]
MNFANPTFLWGLIALSIPIIVHLFNFRKAKLIRFSNVKFLNQVKKKSSSKLQLKQLLVLFCRLTFITFLVLAFAQPFIPGQENGLNENTVIIYLDNSGSMTNLSSENNESLVTAKSMAHQIVDLYPSTTTFKLLDNNFAPSANHYKSADKIREYLNVLDYSSVSRSGQEVLDRIQTLTSNDDRSDVFILSDMQRSTLGQISAYADSIHHHYLIPIATAQQNNLYVDSVYLDQPFILAHKKNTLTAKIKNSSTQAVEDLIVKLQVNDRQSASVAISLEANSTKKIDFELGKNLNKYNAGRIEFQDFPVTFDNEFYFSFNLAPTIRITEITDTQRTPYMQNVFGSNELFDFHSYTTGDINYQVLEQSDLLIIHSLGQINPSIQSQIKLRLTSGKSVLLIPNTNTKLSDLKTSISLQYKATGDTQKTDIQAPDLTNPFFDGIFESLDRKTQLPQANPIIKLSGLHHPLLSLKTGSPFLSKVSQQGNLYVLSSPLTDEFTNFQRHAFFVPVMQRIAELSASSANPLYYSADNSHVTLLLDTIDNQKLYKLRHNINTNQELIPSQRLIQNQLAMDFPKYLLTTGNYQLFSDQQILDYVAFNPSKLESELEIMEKEEYLSLLSDVQSLTLFDQVDSKNFSHTLKEKYHSIELWKYALLLSVLFLIAESMLLRFL